MDGFTLALRRNELHQKLVEKLVRAQVLRESLDDTLRHLLPRSWDIELVIDDPDDKWCTHRKAYSRQYFVLALRILAVNSRESSSQLHHYTRWRDPPVAQVRCIRERGLTL